MSIGLKSINFRFWGENFAKNSRKGFFMKIDNFGIFGSITEKMGKIEKKTLLRTGHLFSFWPKNAKIINFHKNIIF